MHIHFVGIGGVGMSALAELMHRRGCTISGSDRQASELTDRLKGLGVRIQIGHSAEALGSAEAIIYTSAASADNPELRAAGKRGIPSLRRAEFIRELTRDQRVVGIAGTHGKTTTTAMVAGVLVAAEMDPTVLVGGVVRGPESNLRVGRSDLWVIEADEFDRSFLALSPEVAVVTSLEADHLDCYSDLADIRKAFTTFLGNVREGGAGVLWADASEVRGLSLDEGVDRILYGMAPCASLRAEKVEREGFVSRFQVFDREHELGRIRIRVPGLHNVANAMAAVGVGRALGAPWEAIRDGLEGFQGVHRRFEVLGEAKEVTVVSDYAHHPTEIEATLAAAQGSRPGRVLAAFQPHLYSRTRDFSDAFGRALGGADLVFVTDIYAAREEPIPGVSGRLVAESVPDPGRMTYVPDVADLGEALAGEAEPGDLVIVMGAGDVERAGRDLLSLLEEGHSSGV